MSYFHVVISLSDEPSRLRVIFSDLSDRDLRAQFVRPYSKGENLLCGNEIVPVADIRRRHIVRTELREHQERDKLNAKSLAEIEAINRQPGGVTILSPGRGYDPEDILEVGEDVTVAYILGLPGYASRPGILRAFFSNQWVLTVGASLIVAGVVWWLGWG